MLDLFELKCLLEEFFIVVLYRCFYCVDIVDRIYDVIDGI